MEAENLNGLIFAAAFLDAASPRPRLTTPPPHHAAAPPPYHAANNRALTTRLIRNENHQMPLHFAVGHNRPRIVALLIELALIRWRRMGSVFLPRCTPPCPTSIGP